MDKTDARIARGLGVLLTLVSLFALIAINWGCF